MKTGHPTHDQIAARAMEIFRQRGSQPGREQDDWLQAEYELLQLPVRKLADSQLKKSQRSSALISFVQAAVILSTALPRLTR